MTALQTYFRAFLPAYFSSRFGVDRGERLSLVSFAAFRVHRSGFYRPPERSASNALAAACDLAALMAVRFSGTLSNLAALVGALAWPGRPQPCAILADAAQMESR